MTRTPEQRARRAELARARYQIRKANGVPHRDPIKQADAHKRYYLSRREHELAQSKRWAEEHPEQRKASRRAQYLANKEKNNEQAAAWAKANPESRKATYRKYHEKNKEAERSKLAEYNASHRLERGAYVVGYRKTERGRLVAVAAAQRRRARRKDAGTVATKDITRILSIEKCYLCGKRFTTKRPATLDHVIPLAKGGKHHIHNLSAAHGSCNTQKRAKLENPITGQGVLL